MGSQNCGCWENLVAVCYIVWEYTGGSQNCGCWENLVAVCYIVQGVPKTAGSGIRIVHDRIEVSPPPACYHTEIGRSRPNRMGAR